MRSWSVQIDTYPLLFSLIVDTFGLKKCCFIYRFLSTFHLLSLYTSVRDVQIPLENSLVKIFTVCIRQTDQGPRDLQTTG